VIAVEKLAGEPGATIELGEVLMLGTAPPSRRDAALSGARQPTLVEQRAPTDHHLQEKAAAQLPPQKRPRQYRPCCGSTRSR